MLPKHAKTTSGSSAFDLGRHFTTARARLPPAAQPQQSAQRDRRPRYAKSSTFTATSRNKFARDPPDPPCPAAFWRGGGAAPVTAAEVAPKTRKGLQADGTFGLGCHHAGCYATLSLSLPKPLRELCSLEFGHLVAAHGWCAEPVRCAAHLPIQAQERLSWLEQNERLRD